MNKLYVALLSLSVVCVSVVPVALAEEPFDPLTQTPDETSINTAQTAASSSETTSPSADESDEVSEKPCAVQHIVTFPLRFATGSLGLGFGALRGGIKGMGTQPKKFSEATLDQGEEKPWLIPVGIVGLPLSVPYGFLQGFPPGAVETASKWYHLWD